VTVKLYFSPMLTCCVTTQLQRWAALAVRPTGKGKGKGKGKVLCDFMSVFVTNRCIFVASIV